MKNKCLTNVHHSVYQTVHCTAKSLQNKENIRVLGYSKISERVVCRILFIEFFVAIFFLIIDEKWQIQIFVWLIFVTSIIKFNFLNLSSMLSSRTRTILQISVLFIYLSILNYDYLTIKVSFIFCLVAVLAIWISFKFNQIWLLEVKEQMEDSQERLIEKLYQKIEKLNSDAEENQLDKIIFQKKIEDLKFQNANLNEIIIQLEHTNAELIESLDEAERTADAYKNENRLLFAKLNSKEKKSPEIRNLDVISERDLKILNLLDTGLSIRKVGKIVNLSPSMIVKIRSKYGDGA